MVKVVVEIYADLIGKLEEIGKSEKASSGYRQDFHFCLIKAIEEFIKKYDNDKEGDKI